MNAEKYRQYSVEELVDDPDFRVWVNQPTAESDHFWGKVENLSPEMSDKIAAAKELLPVVQNRKGLPDSIVPDEAFARLLTNLVELEKKSAIPSLSQPILRRRWAVAATIAILLSVGLWFGINENEPKRIVYQTGYGEWKEVTLPDGSEVHLNANSKVTLLDNWTAQTDRQVWLEGEAFFEVEKKPQTHAKFRVITEDLTVQVLGTKFNVNTGDNGTSVFLEEGEIALATEREKATMRPNDFARFVKGQPLKIEYKPEENTQTSWKSGTLLLKGQSVANILRRLESIYGCQFKSEDKELLTRTKTLAVPMSKIEILIPILEKTFDASIEQKGNQLIILTNDQ